jgi:hypothetical protein
MAVSGLGRLTRHAFDRDFDPKRCVDCGELAL